MATLQNGQWETPTDYLLPDIIDIRESDGTWIYKARAKWFINRGGEKFSLEKIEQDVLKETGIEVLGFPIKDQRLGEELGLVIQCHPDEFSHQKEKVFFCLKRIYLREFNPEMALPVDEIPRNESQKKDRKKSLEIFCKNLNTL
ncbi:MAG: hypothetical protein HRT44_02615 [Bdellovibrionales bacterium]|nr:hypothetical protein [Bdellovibrionales bacterium]